MTVISEAPEQGGVATDSARSGTDHWLWAVVVSSLLLAVSLPFVALYAGPLWTAIVTICTGALVLLAIHLTPDAASRSGRVGQVLYALGIVFSPVKKYLHERSNVERANQTNRKRYDAMKVIISDYGLDDRSNARGQLEPVLLRPGEELTPVGLDVIASEAAPLVTEARNPSPEDCGRFAKCLELLYVERFDATVADDFARVNGSWHGWSDSEVATLASVMSNHEVFRLSGRPPELFATLIALRNRRVFPHLEKVIGQHRGIPTRVVENMVEVAATFGFDSVARSEHPRIAHALRDVAYSDAPGVVAGEFARLLHPVADEADHDAVAARDQTARQLELLYREQLDRPTSWCWSACARRDPDRRQLARILATAGPLAAPDDAGSGSEAVDRTEQLIAAHLDVGEDFDLAFLRESMSRIGECWRLLVDFNRDLAAARCSLGDVNLPGSSTYTGPIPDREFVSLLRNENAIPGAPSASSASATSALALDLLGRVARQALATPDLARHEVNALSDVTVGLFLQGHGHRHDLATRLALDVSDSDGIRPVADVLLARLWRRRARIDAGEPPTVEVDELRDNLHSWHASACRELGDRLTVEVLAAIRSQLAGGTWPTQLPLPWLLEQFANRIIEGASHTGSTSAQTITDLQEDVAKLKVLRDQDLSEPLAVMFEQIASFDPKSNEARSTDDLENALDAFRDTHGASMARLADNVRSLEKADREVQHVVGALADTDRDMRNALRRLELADAGLIRRIDELERTDVDPHHEAAATKSGHILITWRARAGPVAKLIDFLEREDRQPRLPAVGIYRFDHPSPYARWIEVPEDQSFDDFRAKLVEDLTEVHRHRYEIARGYDWSKHDVEDAVVFVHDVIVRGTQHVPPRSICS